MARTQINGTMILDQSIKEVDLSPELLNSEPPVDFTYTQTRVAGLVSEELWTNTLTSFLIKKIIYTRIAKRVSTIATTFYDIDGIVYRTLLETINRTPDFSIVGDYNEL